MIKVAWANKKFFEFLLSGYYFKTLPGHPAGAICSTAPLICNPFKPSEILNRNLPIFSLTLIAGPFIGTIIQAPIRGLKGNSVKIGDGPGAVIGDESRNKPLPNNFWMGRRGR